MGYLVKYAVQELRVDGGFLNNYEDITKGFIVSKCFLLEDRRIFYDEDKYYHRYVVSFPYGRFDDFITWYRKYRNSTFYNEERTAHYSGTNDKFSIVPRYYDTYEEAMEEKDRCNGILKGDLLFDSTDYGYKVLLSEFNETMLMCDEYEKFIFEKTGDMTVQSDKRNCIERVLNK